MSQMLGVAAMLYGIAGALSILLQARQMRAMDEIRYAVLERTGPIAIMPKRP